MNGVRWDHALSYRRRLQGWTWPQIAKEQGMSPTTISRPHAYAKWLEARGLKGVTREKRP